MSSIILEARDIRYRYPRGLEAICGISFHIRKCEKIAIVGPNGAGKSTLMLLFNGMIRPDSGILLFDNEPVRYDKSSLRMIRKRIGFVLQNPDRQIIAPTVYQDVAFGPVNLGYSESEVKAAVGGALRYVGLEGFERRPPHQLSGGEKKRVAIAGVLAMDPDVLIFDEPTAGLDPSGSEDIMELLDELNSQGKTIIISTHDIELAYPWADRVILLLGGKILQEDIPDVAFGSPEYVRKAHLSMPTLLELYFELEKRGFSLPERKPRTILDMLNVIDRAFHNRPCCSEPGAIMVYNVDLAEMDSFRAWLSKNPELSIGAMGTRAKQRAMDYQITMDFTYGVIDKCILKALLGEGSVILTTESMVQRIFDRVRDFSRENGVNIPVSLLPEASENTE
ncbi:MAG: ATP-binding cassette domain-containing protein [Methanoregulaceae archaeon]|jgi:cobalt/nickel transport system ATP-binding protein|nr:ATP-binding cassette domain-containing protein [Methanoregulaceae archaeon]MCU0629224.1 ATP-binding cassette domain-containing protein [Methanoregulaceae archaeon]